MIINESQTKSIKFECHKEESLISSQFLKSQKKSKALPFLIFYSIILYYNEWMLLIRHDWKIENMKNVVNNKTLNKSWFGLKLAYPK